MATTVSRPPLAERAAARRVRLRPRVLLTHALLLGVGFFYLYPFLWMLAGSLKSLNGFFSQGLALIPDAWHWQNYVEAWQVARFGLYFRNTVVTTTAVVLLVNLISSMAAFALARTRMPGGRLIVGLILLTLFLPRGYTILPTYEIIIALGLNNTLWAVVLVTTAGNLVFNTFLFMGYFRTIPREIEEAARIDGAGFARIYRSIIMPLSGPMVATVTVFTFINTWNDFFTPLVFTIARPELRTLAVGMFAFVSENSRDWTLMCAGAAITIVPIIVVFVFLQRYFIEGIAGAVK
jgi:raffinose/stachyose/melibiose transport system permease protein